MPCAAARSRTIARPYSSAARTENVDGSSSMRPASTFDRSRMSLSSSSRCRPELEDVAQVLVLPVVDVAEHPLEQHLGEADHRVEWRAQLVGHAGQELRLVPAGHLQLAALLLQLAEQPRVDDGQRRLAGECLQEVDGVLGEVAGGTTPNDEGAHYRRLRAASVRRAPIASPRRAASPGASRAVRCPGRGPARLTLLCRPDRRVSRPTRSGSSAATRPVPG